MPTRQYYISFDTKEIPGAIKAVQVSLDNIIVVDQNKSFAINLCDDPLYPLLCRYVKANPPRKD